MPNHYGGLLNKPQQNVGPTPGAQAQPDNSAAAALGNAFKFMGLVASKHIPPRMKVELWNTHIANGLGEILDGGIPTFDVWPTEMDDYAKKAHGILGERNFSSEEKVQALKSLVESAGEDIALAPGIQSFKEDREFQSNVEVMEVMEMMQAGEGTDISDQDIGRFMEIRNRNPKAFVDASEMLDNDRERRRSEGIPQELNDQVEPDSDDDGIFADQLNLAPDDIERGEPPFEIPEDFEEQLQAFDREGGI